MEKTKDTVKCMFGDEQSTLLDRYERLSFEVQLKKAMLGRSLSEPVAARFPPPPKRETKTGLRGLRPGFSKAVKKLLSPMFGGGKRASKSVGHNNPKDPMFWKRFSRSLRV
ncbi:Unknown protein [Striga hermonthica]|uniref:Uncharacterized protein n=1 Tax=Striga hermonthica TaxID=68872 RepID=A0A9N7NJ08_STRHE|nr:Unknown protein [Striga hermonthica]